MTPRPYPRRFQVSTMQGKARTSEQDSVDTGFVMFKSRQANGFPLILYKEIADPLLLKFLQKT